MRKIILSFVTLMICNFLFAQDPDIMNVSIKSSLATYQDCIISIRLSKKDHSAFLFPSKFLIGDDNNVGRDLFIIVEKKREGKFVEYMCKYASAHTDFGDDYSIKYKKYTTLILQDSLESIYCMDSGQYRIKVSYNKRRPDGILELPNIILSSKWKYFYVGSKEIILNRYWLRNFNIDTVKKPH